MLTRVDGPTGHAPSLGTGPRLRDAEAVAELFLDVFRRDILSFFPDADLYREGVARDPAAGPGFGVERGKHGGLRVRLFGATNRLERAGNTPFNDRDCRLVRAVGDVLGLRYHHLFEASASARLELFRGGSEDHYVAAYIEPDAYKLPAPGPSRIARTILTLRTAALSTYENRRVSTGALLMGPGDRSGPTAPDALTYGVELTGLKSLHRLCDGSRTLFRVDGAGMLAGVVDVSKWAGPDVGPVVPCADAYRDHARATATGGHVALLLSPNQEIKIFAEGAQAFAFAHGRWRVVDPAAKFAGWSRAIGDERLAASLFVAALNLAEARQGALFVVVDEPSAAFGTLIGPLDRLNGEAPPAGPRDPLAKRALHYLARGRTVADLDPPVLEALASLDGATAVDRHGRLLAFGAILRHTLDDLPAADAAEGARTTAALVASRFGPVLKVSEDGIVSCFLGGSRAWDL